MSLMLSLDFLYLWKNHLNRFYRIGLKIKMSFHREFQMPISGIDPLKKGDFGTLSVQIEVDYDF